MKNKCVVFMPVTYKSPTTDSVLHTLAWFSLESRKKIAFLWFCITTPNDWFKKNSRHFAIQSEVEPIMTHSRTFSRD